MSLVSSHPCYWNSKLKLWRQAPGSGIATDITPYWLGCFQLLLDISLDPRTSIACMGASAAFLTSTHLNIRVAREVFPHNSMQICCWWRPTQYMESRTSTPDSYLSAQYGSWSIDARTPCLWHSCSWNTHYSSNTMINIDRQRDSGN